MERKAIQKMTDTELHLARYKAAKTARSVCSGPHGCRDPEPPAGPSGDRVTRTQLEAEGHALCDAWSRFCAHFPGQDARDRELRRLAATPKTN